MSRVVSQQNGERNFHIFYQLLIGADQQMADKLQLYSPEYFHYVNQSGCYTVEDVEDAKGSFLLYFKMAFIHLVISTSSQYRKNTTDFQDVIKAMQTVGITKTEQDGIFNILAGILHLGNVQFSEDEKGYAGIPDAAELDLAAKLWSVPLDKLRYSLLFRQMTSGTGNKTETFQSPLNISQADGTRNALARDLYDRMFSWLVEKVNVALDKWKLPKTCVIGILDIFGFEIFEHNGFEQFVCSQNHFFTSISKTTTHNSHSLIIFSASIT